jgi:hypothetical protein
MRDQVMNGAAGTISPDAPPQPKGDPALIRLFEQALEAAKAGQIIAAGMVVVTAPTAWLVHMVGPGACEIHIGAGALQAACLRVATTPRQSPIVRATELPR